MARREYEMVGNIMSNHTVLRKQKDLRCICNRVTLAGHVLGLSSKLSLRMEQSGEGVAG